MTYVQISQRRGHVRGPAGEVDPPHDGFIELGDLDNSQRIVSVEWRRGTQWSRRKTVDWYWTVTIEHRFHVAA